MSNGNDIDFDELDRAVSSLIGSANTTTPQSQQKEQSSAQTSNKDTSLSPQPDAPAQEPNADTPAPNVTQKTNVPQKPAFTSPSEVALPPAKEVHTVASPKVDTTSDSIPSPLSLQSTPTPTVVPEITAKSAPIQAPQRSAPPAVRRAGRFMDVVHPSSDMGKSGAETTGIANSIGMFESKSSEPISRPVMPEIAPSSAPSAAPVVQKSVPSILPTEATKTTGLPAETRWSDSLNFLNRRKKQDTPKPQPRPEAAVVDRPQADQLLSPFLTDAKVEKRPLNAFMGQQSALQEEPQPQPALKAGVEPNTAQARIAANDPQRPASALPPELGEDLVAIEAGEPSGTMGRPDTPPALPPESNSSATRTAPRLHDTPSVRQALSAAATLSIPQQYKTKPVDESSAPHSMFDVEEFKHPLLPAGKKKKGPLFWFVMIFLLLLVGAGVGVGAYYLAGGFN